MDNGCREYLFVVEFFNLTPSAAQDFFDSIFGRTLAYLLVSGVCEVCEVCEVCVRCVWWHMSREGLSRDVKNP